jgi:hypothetical protein
MTDPVQVPVFRVVQVGETVVDQRADEVHRHRRARMALDHPARVGDAGLGGEGRAVDQVATVARQGHAVLALGVGRARLGVLAGEAADAHHRQAHAVHQHQAHLQQHLEAVRDHLGRAVVEDLGAVAALQQEALAILRLRQLLAQVHHFARSHQRRQRMQFVQDAFELLRVAIGRLLHRLAAAPAGGRPTFRGRDHGLQVFGAGHGVFPGRIHGRVIVA